MTGLNVAGESFAGKRKKALTKLHSLREDFRKKEKEVKAELRKAGSIWKQLDERYEFWWWRSQSLP